MPLNLLCSFCGKPIEPGTGLMYVRNDNQRFYFCSHKCEKNQLKLGRRARKLKWTTAYERGPTPPPPKPTEPQKLEEAPEKEQKRSKKKSPKKPEEEPEDLGDHEEPGPSGEDGEEAGVEESGEAGSGE